jgi:hypothetical protein
LRKSKACASFSLWKKTLVLIFCNAVCSEAAMEKHHSRSEAKRMPPVNNDAFSIPPPTVQRHLPKVLDKSEIAQAKPSRKDVSRCITIWASMYLTDNKQARSDNDDLRLPAEPWLGRRPDGIKRF